MQRFDTIVIGAGVIGAAAAWRLAGRGRTLLLEQHAFLHEAGSSHGGSRIFRHAYEDREHVRLAVAADALWGELEAATGERLLHRCGGLDLGAAGHGELDAIEVALSAEGRPVERLVGATVRARFPAFGVGDDVEALYQPDAAIVPATRAVATLLRAAAAEGAALRDREPVRAIRAGADGVEVVTAVARYAAERLVVAAGPWLAGLLPELELPLRVEQQQVLYLRVGADARAFAPGRMPLFIDRRGGIYGFPLFERPDAVKVSDHEGAPTIRLEERSDRIDPDRAAATVAAARRLLPGLDGELVGGQTCLYTKTPDERFVLDRHPEHPRVVVAGGGSGHAFKFGPVLGEIAAELACSEGPAEGATDHPIGGFAIARMVAR
ncbi:MAG: N-methyl-L-tryptophan oxidase [Trueperaceae bacterium]|nr:N-methyl-L-tryptophan oxidase [Trueperaceae bacterium]